MRENLKTVIKKYPNSFWILVLGTFIDRLGGFMLFTFYSLFVVMKFQIQMTQVGLLFTFMSIGSLFGGFLGGALTDKFGRKFMMLFGLIVSGLSSLIIPFIGQLEIFYVVCLLTGFLGAVAGPAHQALVADLLPEELRSSGYALLRISVNIGATLGPIIGGFMLIGNNFEILFFTDAITSMITTIVVFLKIPETKPETTMSESLQIAGEAPQKRKETPQKKSDTSFLATMKGYAEVLRDGHFILFVGIIIIMQLVYMQMYSTLSVYLLNFKQLSASRFGIILSINAITVVLLQYTLSQKIAKFPPLVMMAIGMIFYGVGFTMYGFTSSYLLFIVAMELITIGEMIIFPLTQSIVAGLAPEDKRGRYSAIQMAGFIIPNLFGNLGAGMIYDQISPQFVWYTAGILSVVGFFGFLILQKTSAHRLDKNAATSKTKSTTPDNVSEILEGLEISTPLKDESDSISIQT